MSRCDWVRSDFFGHRDERLHRRLLFHRRGGHGRGPHRPGPDRGAGAGGRDAAPRGELAHAVVVVSMLGHRTAMIAKVSAICQPVISSPLRLDVRRLDDFRPLRDVALQDLLKTLWRSAGGLQSFTGHVLLHLGRLNDAIDFPVPQRHDILG